MKLKVQLLNGLAKMPVFGTAGAACFDLHTTITGPITIYPHSVEDVFKTHILGTGLAFEIPEDYVMLVFSRSGHGFTHDIRLANCVGVIDSDYRGEVKVKLVADNNPYTVNPGERVAQAMLIKKPMVEFVQVDNLSNTVRGAGGTGSTGKT